MFCNKCPYSPKNYYDYCKSKQYKDTDELCPDAFEERAEYCTMEEEMKKKENENG